MEIVIGLPTTPSPLSSSRTSTDPPSRSRWWTQLQSLFLRRKELTKNEKLALHKLNLYVMFTVFPVFTITVIFLGIRLPHCHANFSVESISVTPSSSSTWWHVDFLVENPNSSSCLVYYNGHNVQAKVGSLNAAVLETSRRDDSSGRHTSFLVDLATEGNHSHVFAASPRGFELELKLSAKDYLSVGHFEIRCQNLTIGYEKIRCYSSFQRTRFECC
ncbi:uncharacterized protein LOC17881593 [Capsella rubella]|uniref:uncharacterized protein LOC17881593 n=1 Tax=Capsella rubella TaxID=81985 RepID=UPI000CD51974|nr:uncharacterized protein LOC17881593 [Capsella rubella]